MFHYLTWRPGGRYNCSTFDIEQLRMMKQYLQVISVHTRKIPLASDINLEEVATATEG